ncbi:MAG: SEL1-like repeat protein, partial [Methylobacillus sp.]|nr:SEL1-like repeat protein [Methylobacillus sp.]
MKKIAAILLAFFAAYMFAACSQTDPPPAAAPVKEDDHAAAEREAVLRAAALVDTLRAKADQGDADAQYALASRYETGAGVKEDAKQAAEWYAKALAEYRKAA